MRDLNETLTSDVRPTSGAKGKKGRQQPQSYGLRPSTDPFTVQLFSDFSETESATDCSACGDVRLKMELKCRAAVPAKSSVGAAVLAVKQDAIRSLCSRAGTVYTSILLTSFPNIFTAKSRLSLFCIRVCKLGLLFEVIPILLFLSWTSHFNFSSCSLE